MKTLLNALVIGLAGNLSLGLFSASADLEVSASVQIHATAEFQAPLGAHGTWIEVGSYGRCWRPAGVAMEWRPYGYGHWVWTDCGWYWVSDEPWAWACYHYGWWVNDSFHGWVWVPGIEWAPAWVSWRVGGGFIGWAPLPPRGVILAPPLFAFVEVHRFHEPVRPGSVIVNNTTIINKTTVINNTKRETRSFDGAASQRVVVNEGPGVELIQKATGKKVSAVPIREAARQTPVSPAIERRTSESTGKQKPPAALEQPKSAPERKPSQGEAPDRPAKPAPPDKGKPSPREDVSPPPERPPSPGAPPARPAGPPRGKGEGKGHGKERP